MRMRQEYPTTLRDEDGKWRAAWRDGQTGLVLLSEPFDTQSEAYREIEKTDAVAIHDEERRRRIAYYVGQR